MKKFIMSAFTVAVMAGFSTNASAQEGFNVSVKGVPQFTFLQNSDDSDNGALSKKATFNTKFGIGAGYNFTENMGVGLDAMYSFQGQKYEILGVETQQKLEYVKIPVYFSYNTDATQLVSFYGKIGPQLSLLTNAEFKSDVAPTKENKGAYKNVIFGGMAEVGAQFKIQPKLYLSTGINFDYDFTNAEDKDYIGYTPGRSNTNNMTVGLQVGLKYQL